MIWQAMRLDETSSSEDTEVIEAIDKAIGSAGDDDTAAFSRYAAKRQLGTDAYPPTDLC